MDEIIQGILVSKQRKMGIHETGICYTQLAYLIKVHKMDLLSWLLHGKYKC